MSVELTELTTYWTGTTVPPLTCVPSTTTAPEMVACGICSNGPNLVWHIGGPCPYAHKPTCPHCGLETS